MEKLYTLNETLGNNLRELRTENGLTQAQLSEQLQITEKALSNIERGLCWIRLEHLEKLAEIFAVSPSRLLETPEEKNETFKKTLERLKTFHAEEKLKFIEQILKDN